MIPRASVRRTMACKIHRIMSWALRQVQILRKWKRLSPCRSRFYSFIYFLWGFKVSKALRAFWPPSPIAIGPPPRQEKIGWWCCIEVERPANVWIKILKHWLSGAADVKSKLNNWPINSAFVANHSARVSTDTDSYLLRSFRLSLWEIKWQKKNKS